MSNPYEALDPDVRSQMLEIQRCHEAMADLKRKRGTLRGELEAIMDEILTYEGIVREMELLRHKAYMATYAERVPVKVKTKKTRRRKT